jgi:hypothetical protein
MTFRKPPGEGAALKKTSNFRNKKIIKEKNL